ncbi:hypothetical protein [Paraglaciecola sp. 25GB23A]|uniref:hypothetical protein n=1 Tax=Paraglaciecola sp. 25GB23A TaxID=3156068 RepID=UPI0032B0216A
MTSPSSQNTNNVNLINLIVSDGLTRSSLCSFAVPLPKERVICLSQLSLLENDKAISCNAKITSRWQDDSIKWVTFDFFCNVDNAEYSLQLSDVKRLKNKAQSEISCQTDQDNIEIVIDELCFKLLLDTARFTLHQKNRKNETIEGYLQLFDQSQVAQSFDITSHKLESFIDLFDGSVQKVELILELCGVTAQTSHIKNTLYFTFYNQQNTVSIEHTLHNSKAATHTNGHWDLGDKGSILFDSANICLEFNSIKVLQLQSQVKGQWHETIQNQFTLFQASSGGKNWLSPVHVNSSGQIPFSKKGALLDFHNQVEIEILRATPTVYINDIVLFTFEKFWQNFPKALVQKGNSFICSLFPTIENSPHELQGGESKTHKMWLSLGKSKTNLDWVHKRIYLIPPATWTQQVLLNTPYVLNQGKGLFDDLFEIGISGKESFFNKREKLDEFGWRNFGDIYADHETAGYNSRDTFVSHYNNQYDPILGFLRQYLSTQDKRWFELADDLARHVKNIDIYQTTEDKAEYNGGLFWHTDHYLQAYTSSHRSYSKHQTANAYQDHAGGGGPGGQHCYTSGMALHYFIAGEETSKQAVLTLTNWITHVYEGSGTCLELLLALKNRNLLGIKNHFTGQYPLDRGTANYIIALLDSFELTNEHHYLLKAEHVIINTVHPNEDIKQRKLTDVETTWFYTVFLQAVVRYLSVKETRNEMDDNFYYCRDCLINFADWMADNEYMYLDKPDILEYPNDTWTAQDLRKANVLAAAYYYAPDKKQDYLTKAIYFENEVAHRLNSSLTKTYTRILVLVLQNCGMVDFYKNRKQVIFEQACRQDWPRPNYESRNLVISIIKSFSQRLLKLSIKNEINWLKKRLK